MMRLRDEYLKQVRKKSDPTTITLYKQFRNRVGANELIESKASYFHNYLNENRKNTKLLWIGIKSIISIKYWVNVINKLKNANGNLTAESATMATVFNDFFVNVADAVTKIIPRSPKSLLDYLGNENQHYCS